METVQCRSYGEAIEKALAWLIRHDITALDVVFETRMHAFGMRTNNGSSGYRLEFDTDSGAHINVWHHKIKGPHYVFPGNEQEVRTKWRQLYFWDKVELRTRSYEDIKI